VLATLVLSSFIWVEQIGEDNILYVMLISRLEYDDSKGNIAGYNRTDENVDFAFSRFVDSPDFFWGSGVDSKTAITEGSAGYKVYLIRFGLISAAFVVLFYLAFAFNYRQYEVATFFILLLLMLFQNSYPFWFCVVFGYILGVAELYDKDVRPDDTQEAAA
jgi:hypothetical protein